MGDMNRTSAYVHIKSLLTKRTTAAQLGGPDFPRLQSRKGGANKPLLVLLLDYGRKCRCHVELGMYIAKLRKLRRTPSLNFAGKITSILSLLFQI